MPHRPYTLHTLHFTYTPHMSNPTRQPTTPHILWRGSTHHNPLKREVSI